MATRRGEFVPTRDENLVCTAKILIDISNDLGAARSDLHDILDQVEESNYKLVKEDTLLIEVINLYLYEMNTLILKLADNYNKTRTKSRLKILEFKKIT